MKIDEELVEEWNKQQKWRQHMEEARERHAEKNKEWIKPFWWQLIQHSANYLYCTLFGHRVYRTKQVVHVADICLPERAVWRCERCGNTFPIRKAEVENDE